VQNAAKSLGFSPDNLDKQTVQETIRFLVFRFCGLPDSPPQTDGAHPLSYGQPIGRWGRGNLTINVNAVGAQGVSPAAISNIVFGAYNQYQAAQPFFSFSPGGANADIRVQFGGTNLDSRLGTPNGAVGVGGAPPSGNLYLASNFSWTAPILQSVVLHEAGHTLGLGHSTLSTSVMYPVAPSIQVLDPETIEAIQGLYGWTPQISLSDRASSDGPSLAFVNEPAFGGPGISTLYMAWKGTEGDSGIYFASSGDGVTWSAQEKIEGIGSSDGPALATFRPPSPDGFPHVGLFMAWKGIADDHNVYWAMNLNLEGFAEQHRIDVGTSARPALVEYNGQMVLAWKGVPGDSGIYWSKLDPIQLTWSPQQQIAGRGTSHAPAMVVFNGQLHMFWKGIGSDDNVFHAILIDPQNGIWGPQEVVTFIDAGDLYEGQTPVPIGSSNGPAATVRGNELFLAWKGIPGDHELWLSRYDSASFSGQIAIPGVGSEAGPGVANLNGRIVLAWRGIGGDHGLWVSTLG